MAICRNKVQIPWLIVYTWRSQYHSHIMHHFSIWQWFISNLMILIVLVLRNVNQNELDWNTNQWKIVHSCIDIIWGCLHWINPITAQDIKHNNISAIINRHCVIGSNNLMLDCIDIHDSIHNKHFSTANALRIIRFNINHCQIEKWYHYVTMILSTSSVHN